MEGYGIIMQIILGGVAGWIAEKVMGFNTGLIMNIILGIVGAVVGNWLLGLVNIGLGGMIGIEFVTDKKSKAPAARLTAAIISEAAQNGLLVEGAGIHGNVIRFLAPLVITNAQLKAGLDILEAAIVKCSRP